MANFIVTDGLNYFTSFVDGQGTPATSYFSLSIHLDKNFETLRDTVNTLVAEIRSLSGSNTLIPIDLLLPDDPTITTPTTNGRIGVNSVRITVNGGDAKFWDVSAGAVMINGARFGVLAHTKDALATLGTNPQDPVFINIDTNGVTNINVGPGAGIRDIAEADWNGATFNSITELLDTYFDGDEWWEMKQEPANTPFTSGSYEVVHTRLNNFSKAFGGFRLNEDSEVIGPMVLGGGTVALPAFVLGDGANPPVIDATSGLLRVGADILGISASGTLVARFGALGLRLVNGTINDPSLQIGTNDESTGWYRNATNEWSFSANTARVFGLSGAGLKTIAGTAGAPSYSSFVANRDDGGLFFPADGEVAISANTIEAIRFKGGIVDLPANPRVRGIMSGSQNYADSATAVEVQFDGADEYDVGDWHTPGADTAGEEFTCPAGAGGTYTITVNYDWAESITNPRQIFNGITLNDVEKARERKLTEVGEFHGGSMSCTLAIAAAQVVRVTAKQEDGVGSLTLDLTVCDISITKEA